MSSLMTEILRRLGQFPFLPDPSLCDVMSALDAIVVSPEMVNKGTTLVPQRVSVFYDYRGLMRQLGQFVFGEAKRTLLWLQRFYEASGAIIRCNRGITSEGEQAKASVPWASYDCTWFMGRLGQLFYFQAHGNISINYWSKEIKFMNVLSFWCIFQAFVFLLNSGWLFDTHPFSIV